MEQNETIEIDAAGMTVRDAAALVRERRVTARRLTEAFLRRVERYNPGYNAIVTMNPDALAEADAVDAALAAGESVGPLAGVPVVVKDTIDMAGLPTTGGWRGLSRRAGGVDLVPKYDAPAVQRLRRAGAVIIGKTNVPVMSFSGNDANNSCFGPTYNAASPRHAPGGSSTGSATAVAAGLALAGLAVEAGGSIQNPAAAQALTAIKPTFGLVPNSGVLPLGACTRDTVGALAKTVADVALLLDVLAGFTADDPKTIASFGNMPRGGYASGLKKGALAGKRLGLYGTGWKKRELCPETSALYAGAVKQIRLQGAQTVADPFAGTGFADIALEGYDYRGDEFVAFDFQRYLDHADPDASRTLADIAAMTGEDVFGEQGAYKTRWNIPGYREALADPRRAPDMSGFAQARERYIAAFNAVMREHDLDACVFPQMFRELPAMFGKGSIGATTVSEINIGGFPAVVVPAGYYASGCPFALIFVGRLWDDAGLLNLAHDFEQATRARRTPELVESPEEGCDGKRMARE